jgi:predicted aspartyl protease
VPRWRFPYDRDGVPSLDVRVQARGGLSIDLSGTVDSGASTTVLSREVAQKLGLSHADLSEAVPAVIADGSEVRCWSTTKRDTRSGAAARGSRR